MSYIDETLVGSEEIKYITNFHWTYSMGMWFWLIFFGWMGIGVIIFLIMFIHKKTTELGVTTSRIVKKSGWISRKTEELSLGRIEEMNLTQGILGRVLGYGKIQINGTGGSYILTHSIDDPMEFRKAIGLAKEQVV